MLKTDAAWITKLSPEKNYFGVKRSKSQRLCRPSQTTQCCRCIRNILWVYPAKTHKLPPCPLAAGRLVFPSGLRHSCECRLLLVDPCSAIFIHFLSFTPNLITVILSSINSRSLNLVSTRSRLGNLWPVSRTVVKAPKSCYTTPVLRCLHWLRINEVIEYKLLSLIYKVLVTTQPPHIHNLISVQRSCITRSLSIVTLTSSSIIITDRPFCFASPCPWTQPLQHDFVNLIPVSVLSFPTHPCLHPLRFDSPLCSFITPSLFFTPGLKLTCLTNPTARSFTFSSRTAFADYCFFRATRFLFLVFLALRSWPFCQLLSARKYTVSYRIVLLKFPTRRVSVDLQLISIVVSCSVYLLRNLIIVANCLCTIRSNVSYLPDIADRCSTMVHFHTTVLHS